MWDCQSYTKMSVTVDNNITIREAEVSDLPLLYSMLFEAAATNPEVEKMDREAALSLPQIRKYVEGWGREGDRAFVAAEPAGRPLGAAWYRIFPEEDPAYGYVSPDVPELTIGVVEDARRKGIGTQLMQRIIDAARGDGYRALSLSVEKDSKAVELYKRYGFESQGPSDQRPSSFTMLLTL